MRLDLDCVRDILMDIEEITVGDINSQVKINKDNYMNLNYCQKYDYDKLIYHLRQCNLNGFFLNCSQTLGNAFILSDLTPKAHEFIANIRKESNWDKIKKELAKIGSYSLSLAAQIAANIVQNRIENIIQ